jgi:hypothetical protein
MRTNTPRYDLEHGFTPGWTDLDESTLGELVLDAHADCADEMGESPRVHVALHVIAEKQTVEFPPAARALTRLIESGASRHEAIHHIAFLTAELINEKLRAGDKSDSEEELGRRLDASLNTVRHPVGGPLDQAGWDGFSLDWLVVDEPAEASFEVELHPEAGQWTMRLLAAFEEQADKCQGWAIEYVEACLIEHGDFRGLTPSVCIELFEPAFFFSDAGPREAGQVLSELQALFSFCGRQYGMAHGEACATALATAQVRKQFRKMLADKPSGDDLTRITDLMTPDDDGNYSPQATALLGQAAEGPATMAPPFVRTEARVGRNEPCPCGSGKKYKKCCG